MNIEDRFEDEAVMLEQEIVPLGVRGSVEASLAMVASDAEAKGVEVSCVIDDAADVTILGDRVRLRQIMTNLLDSAVTLTDAGAVQLVVHAQPTVRADNIALHFTIAEAGESPRAHREPDSSGQPDDGPQRTGAGLSTARRLVDLVGGRLWTEGHPGAGVTIHFIVEAAQAPGGAESLGRSEPDPGPTTAEHTAWRLGNQRGAAATPRARSADFDLAIEQLTKSFGKQFVAELLETFLRNGPNLLHELRTAVEIGNAATARRAAHTLKANGTTFGATALADLCQRAEELAKEGNLGGVAEHIEAVEREYRQVRITLKDMREELVS